jgi:TetR/AcrR family transcriptional regulator, ethionamide resistance regulator
MAVQRARRRQPPEETRRQIIDAAVELLGEQSFRDLTPDAVMARAGYTRTLFYRHFDDLPALLLALMQELGAELVTLAEDWSRTERVGPDVARARLTGFVEFQTRHAAVVRAVAEAAHHDEAVEQASNAITEGFVSLTARAIQARIDSGELAPLDAPEISRALVRMLNGYLLDPRRSADPDRALETVWTVWTRTLFPGTDPGA